MIYLLFGSGGRGGLDEIPGGDDDHVRHESSIHTSLIASKLR